VRLVFDAGTVVVLDADPRIDLSDIPGLLWDPRVQRYRAAACRHREVASALAGRGVRFSDEVLAGARSIGGWREVPLRAYQKEALQAWERAGHRGVVVLPTGSGKTRVALGAMAIRARPALCLVPTRVLLDQWVREIARFLAGDVGRYGDGDRVLRSVTVSTYESAFRNMDVLGDRFELLVVDEAHHFGGGAHDDALVMCAAPMRLGLTATPLADAGAGEKVRRLIGDTVYQLTIPDLAGSFLAAFDVITLRVDLTTSERERYERCLATHREAMRTLGARSPGMTWRDLVAAAQRSEGGRAGLRAWRESRRIVACCDAKRTMVQELLRQHRDDRTLVFTHDNATAYALARDNLVMPITCDIQRGERAEALECFRRGALRALVSARVLNEGLDVPDADVAIIVGGALGEREHVQRVGRLLRPAPGKRATVYELVARKTAEVAQAARRRRGLVARPIAPVPPAG
jgi:superfamily II DNA or RNA helicase